MARITFILILAVVIASLAFAAWAAAPQIFWGQEKPLGQGTIRTWVKLDQGKPTAIGVTFSEAALSGLPDTMPYTEYVLTFPAPAKEVPFSHFVANWNPKGHIPAGVFDVPHFDFHFYLISPQVRDGITAVGDDLAKMLKNPEARYIPKDYMTVPGAAEPRMGNHWLDLGQSEFHGKPFTVDFIYGFYTGELAFIEPMATRAFLQTKPSFTAPIKQPAEFLVHGYYPTSYSVKYDPAGKCYTVALEGLTMR